MIIDIDSALHWIKDQGFAIFVATYLLLRIERKLDKVIGAINGKEKSKTS